ncbi:Slp family lipoprotein [Methylophaga sp. OBS4]|uniref:Slp family lipoprotein n=1 Tax=Methylophaga sp. OBS4 TaxID=2991935 RepID=UPI0022562C42|nr:Slp family lipoprotein [Methylophaga sp. OBS4]MCX4187418.1 Slp family lipoprotein [Methylophaga sp. OBS4]
MKIFIYAAIALLTACSGVSSNIQSAPAGDIQLKQVVTGVETYMGTTVRWGGKIISISNYETYSSLQIVQFPLNRYGRPIADRHSQGRFISQSKNFLDPEIYQEGTMVTFVGTVSAEETIKVDQKTLTLPVIDIIDSHLWIDKYSGTNREYNPKHDAPFVGYGYYGTGYYSP